MRRMMVAMVASVFVLLPAVAVAHSNPTYTVTPTVPFQPVGTFITFQGTTKYQDGGTTDFVYVKVRGPAATRMVRGAVVLAVSWMSTVVIARVRRDRSATSALSSGLVGRRPGTRSGHEPTGTSSTTWWFNPGRSATRPVPGLSVRDRFVRHLVAGSLLVSPLA